MSESDIPALLAALEEIVSGTQEQRRDSILAALHRQGVSFRRLAEIVGRDHTTVRDWVLRAPEEEVQVADDWERITPEGTMAHIESVYDDWNPVSADELYQALSEIAAITPPQPDSPTGWEWALRQLEVLARQALEHRDDLSPVSAAFSYRQGMIYRQFRLRRYGTDRHADLRDHWLDIVARLALEANQRHPGALARWIRTRLVSTEEAVEMLERMRHIQTDPATTLDPPHHHRHPLSDHPALHAGPAAGGGQPGRPAP